MKGADPSPPSGEQSKDNKKGRNNRYVQGTKLQVIFGPPVGQNNTTVSLDIFIYIAEASHRKKGLQGIKCVFELGRRNLDCCLASRPLESFTAGRSKSFFSEGVFLTSSLLC